MHLAKKGRRNNNTDCLRPRWDAISMSSPPNRKPRRTPPRGDEERDPIRNEDLFPGEEIEPIQEFIRRLYEDLKLTNGDITITQYVKFNPQ